jgi:hypothetical protein
LEKRDIGKAKIGNQRRRREKEMSAKTYHEGQFMASWY